MDVTIVLNNDPDQDPVKKALLLRAIMILEVLTAEELAKKGLIPWEEVVTKCQILCECDALETTELQLLRIINRASRTEVIRERISYWITYIPSASMKVIRARETLSIAEADDLDKIVENAQNKTSAAIDLLNDLRPDPTEKEIDVVLNMMTALLFYNEEVLLPAINTLDP